MPTLHFDWQAPPLNENQRWSHWARKAEVVKSTRLAGRLAAARLRGLGRVEVTLIWYVNDKRRRDEDNPTPTLKALCDGLVDAGVVPDDTPEWMIKNGCRIVYEKGGTPRIDLEVTPIR
jgi:Holliday junction resolvase RusA-like endonuclease